MISNKSVCIPGDLYAKIETYAHDCIPQKTADEIATELVDLGIDALTLQLKARLMLKPNPNTE